MFSLNVVYFFLIYCNSDATIANKKAKKKAHIIMLNAMNANSPLVYGPASFLPKAIIE
jgi:hypothetical protein